MERYKLYTKVSCGNWKPACLWVNKISEMTSEIIACINCGDQVMIKDTLKNREIHQDEIKKILKI